jgi:hypothetical protein
MREAADPGAGHARMLGHQQIAVVLVEPVFAAAGVQPGHQRGGVLLRLADRPCHHHCARRKPGRHRTGGLDLAIQEQRTGGDGCRKKFPTHVHLVLHS